MHGAGNQKMNLLSTQTAEWMTTQMPQGHKLSKDSKNQIKEGKPNKHTNQANEAFQLGRTQAK